MGDGQRQKIPENILVVKKDVLFPEESLQGFQEMGSFDAYQKTVENHKEFHNRWDMEENPSYKQIIPYLIFSFEDKVFLMQRKGSASEERLKNKYTLGIGGHIREADITGKSISEWAKREFDEEVRFNGSYTIQPLGMINDESNAVGQVHLGFAFLLTGDSDKIAVRSELKHGVLLSVEECESYFDSMETWSQIAFTYLKQYMLKQNKN